MFTKENEGQWIALFIVILSVVVAFGALMIGKNDEAIKQPIILAMVSLISGLLGLGGGILTSGSKKVDSTITTQTPTATPPKASNLGGGVSQ